MPNNVHLTPKVMARFVLFGLGNKLNLARNMTKAITPEFAKPAYKIGDTVQVYKPYRFVGGDGLEFNPEPIVDQVTPISVTQVPHVHFFWDSVERTLEVREAMELYTEPAAVSMASKINAQGATFAANNAMMSVGTPGTAPTSESSYLDAVDRLYELGLPDNEPISLFVNRKLSSAFVKGVKAQFNPTGTIGKQWAQGKMMAALGIDDIYIDQTINVRTNGTFSGTPLTDSTGTTQQAEGGNNATMSLITNGWGSGVTALKRGDRFTIGSATSATVGGVNAVHPQTRISIGQQQIFTVVNNISDISGAITMVIYPAITPSGQYQNVDSAAVDNAIITMIGTSALTNIAQGILMHKNAFAFVSVPLMLPGKNLGTDGHQETDSDTGLTLRYRKWMDNRPSNECHAFDALVGFGNLYREMAVVVQG